MYNKYKYSVLLYSLKPGQTGVSYIGYLSLGNVVFVKNESNDFELQY